MVIGWLWVPTFTSGELKSAIRHVNRKTANKATKRIGQTKRKANKAYGAAVAGVTVVNRFSRRISVLRKSRKHAIHPIPGTGDGNEEVETGSTQVDAKPIAEQIEPKTYTNPNPTPLSRNSPKVSVDTVAASERTRTQPTVSPVLPAPLLYPLPPSSQSILI